MTPSAVFTFANTFALVAWIFLVCGARWLPTAFRIARYGVPSLLALLYIFSLAVAEPVEGASFTTLEGVTALFTSEWSVVGGWIHYLAFDFFVGCWILARAKAEEMPHWLILIPLFFTFMLGPIGLLLFFITSGIRKKLGKSKTG